MKNRNHGLIKMLPGLPAQQAVPIHPTLPPIKSTMLKQYDLYNTERRFLLLEELGLCSLFHRLAPLREEYSCRLVVVVLDGVEVPCTELVSTNM